MRRRNLLAGAACLLLVLVIARSPNVLAGQAAAVQPPVLQVDPLWPKPLPNHWILGSVTGVRVDAKDHVWLVHRGAASLNARQEMGLATSPPGSEFCCSPAPSVLEFDPAGNLVGHWGGPGDGYDWPQSPGGLAIDGAGNVWIAAAGATETEGSGRGRGRSAGSGQAATAPPPPRPQDAHVLKFSRAGKFLLQIGKPGRLEGTDSQTTLNRPTAVDVDPAASEVYVADAGNRRIVVFDAATGAYKRHWGAYGEKPGEAAAGPYDPKAEAAKQFRTLSCVKLAKDETVYVCDRQNDRIQVFRKDGTFVKEAFVSKTTTGDGSVWDVAFSSDPQQRFVFAADGQDQKVFILRRDTLAVVSSFGGGGRYPGYFFGVGSIATDSKGNVYTGETYEGKRLQRFVVKGTAARGGSG